MLKKIATTDLQLGMHLERFEGAWIDHPFWRSRFVIDDEATLALARRSAVRECWIDTAKGLDVAAPTGAPAPAAVAASAPTAPLHPAPALTSETSLGDELRNAAVLCQQAEQVVASLFADARLGRAVSGEKCQTLVQEVTDSVSRNRMALVSLARLKTADDYSHLHSVAVCALMVSLARGLGLSQDECRDAGLAGLLHDVGKAVMPLDVLNKPGKLTDAEFAVIRTHPQRGHDLLVGGGGVTATALDVCLHHHEKFDGAGYPHRLAGEQITLFARMGAVCDVYDAVSSNRPYKAGWDPAESLAQMASWKGHFDPAVFATFIKCLGIYPTGSLVRLASGRLAVVLEQNPVALTAPVVNVFFSTKANLPLPVERLDLARSNDRILGREARSAWNFPQIEKLWTEAGLN